MEEKSIQSISLIIKINQVKKITIQLVVFLLYVQIIKEW